MSRSRYEQFVREKNAQREFALSTSQIEVSTRQWSNIYEAMLVNNNLLTTMQSEILKIRKQLDDINSKSPDVNSSTIFSVNYSATQVSQVNIFTELMKNDKFCFSGKLKFSKVSHNEFTVDFCSQLHADKSTELVINELKSKNIEVRVTKRTYSSKKISSSFINKHALDSAFPTLDEKEQERLIIKSLIMKNDFFLILSMTYCQSTSTINLIFNGTQH